MADEPPERDADPLAHLAERAQEYAGIWRSAIDRNAASQYKPEDWFDDVNRTWVLAAEDAARAFAAVVDAMAARSAGTTDPGEDPSTAG